MVGTKRESRRRRFASAARLAILGGLAAVTGLSAADPDRRSWTDYNGSPDNSKYSTLRQIDKVNVSKLEVAWTYPYGETFFNPIVVHGVVYAKGRNSSLIALDAATG